MTSHNSYFIRTVLILALFTPLYTAQTLIEDELIETGPQPSQQTGQQSEQHTEQQTGDEADGSGEIDHNEKRIYNAFDFPNPATDYEECGTDKFSWICDPGHYLKKSELAELNELIFSYRKVSTWLCGLVPARVTDPEHVVMVAIVPHIKYGATQRSSPVEAKAVRLLAEQLRTKTWRRDDSYGCPIQLYIVYDVNAQKIYTTKNDYAGMVISDERAWDVSVDAKLEYMDKGEIYEGLKDIITKFKEDLERGPPRPPALWIIVAIILGSLLFIGLVVCICYKYSCQRTHTLVINGTPGRYSNI